MIPEASGLIAEAGSPWHADSAGPQHAALAHDLDVDVVVVGAGIVGLMTAWHLADAGASVAVLEAREVAAATSGNNTAKLSSLQGLVYSQLARHGREVCEQFALANESGINRIEALITELGIECAWKQTANHTFAATSEDLPKLERELECSQAAGLPTELVADIPLPFETAGALRLAGQAQFDPVAFLGQLAQRLDSRDQVVHEGTRVREVSGGEVRTDRGHRVKADQIVLATHLPIVDRLGMFARAEPMASFAITVELAEPAIEGMFIDTAGQHSLRALEAGGRQLAIVGGQGHRLGTGDPTQSLAELRQYATERLGAGSVHHAFDAHDFVTEDRLPFVGPVQPGSEAILTATGMNKWGLALGSECGWLLAETIKTGAPSWPRAFDSRRLPRPRSWPTLVANAAETGWHLVGDRLKRSAVEEIPRGGGAVVGAGLAQRAVHRDGEGRLHSLSARCPHLGCIVAWNQAARTWDCPCHGSRFGIHGSVLEGPARTPLPRHEPSPQ